jgi:hypothetical protein
MKPVTVKELLDSGERLGITRIAGPADSARPARRVLLYPDQTGGPFPRVLPDHVALVLSPAAVKESFRKECSGRHFPAACRKISCLALPGREIPTFFQGYAKRTGTPVFASRFDQWLIHSRLTGLLREIGQRRVMVHGSLVRLAGRGVLLMGESGVGKTSTGIAAMHSDNRWVADDAVVLEAREGLLYGRGHAGTRDWISVRGRGILRSEELLGAERLLAKTRVDLIVRLICAPGRENDAVAQPFHRYAGVSIPCRELLADEAPPRMAERLMDCVRCVQAG